MNANEASAYCRNVSDMYILHFLLQEGVSNNHIPKQSALCITNKDI